MDQQILELLKKMDSRLERIENKVDGIEKKLDGVVDQTADLTEFRTTVLSKLEELKEVEEVTKVNCYEIAKIKAIK